MIGSGLRPRFPLFPLKRLADIRPSGVDKIVDPEERAVRLCNYLDVYRNSRINPGMNFSAGSASDAEIERFTLRGGDVLITKDSETPDDIAVPALVEAGDDDLVCGYHLAIVRPDPTKLLGPFLYYALASEIVRDQFSVRAQGITRFGLTVNGIGSVLCPHPPLVAQRAIADFLDRETGRIDALIAKKERLVELQRDRAKSLVWTLTTGRDRVGIDRDATAFAWIGSIPIDWRAVRIKQVARLESGHTPSRSNDEYWSNPTIPWVSLADSGQLRQRDVLYETTYKISEEGLANSSARILPAGTVVFTRDATVGLAAILGIDMAVSQHIVGWVCGPELRPFYLLYVIRAMEHELNRITWGATIKTIGMPDILNLSCPLPPVAEQDEIVARLDAELGRTHELERKVLASIDLLRALRSSLITAAVTGQIDPTTWRRRGSTERALDAVESSGDRARVAS